MSEVLISSVSPLSEKKASGLNGLSDRLLGSLETSESNIIGDIEQSLSSSSPLMNAPEHMLEHFKRWEASVSDPEDKRMVAALKQKTIEMYNDNSAYIKERIQGKGDNIALKMAVKAVTKTISGVQQLLSAQ